MEIDAKFSKSELCHVANSCKAVTNVCIVLQGLSLGKAASMMVAKLPCALGKTASETGKQLAKRYFEFANSRNLYVVHCDML